MCLVFKSQFFKITISIDAKLDEWKWIRVIKITRF